MVVHLTKEKWSNDLDQSALDFEQGFFFSPVDLTMNNSFLQNDLTFSEQKIISCFTSFKDL